MQARLGGRYGVPVVAPTAYCDYGSGNLATFGMHVTLYQRLPTGAGQQVHSSLARARTVLQVPNMVACPGARWDELEGQRTEGQGALDRLYRRSDRWRYLATSRRSDRDRLERVEGLAGLPIRRTAALEQAPAQRFTSARAGMGGDAASARAAEHACSWTSTSSWTTSALGSLGLSLDRDHPGIGRVSRSRRAVDPPLADPASRAPRVDPSASDTRRVLAALGYDGEVDRLIEVVAVREGLPEGSAFVGMFR